MFAALNRRGYLGIVCLVAFSNLSAQPTPPPAPRAMQMITIGGSRSFLGVGVREMDAERAKALNLNEEAGVEVTAVEPNSPAAKAGLKMGDTVVEYNGQRVDGAEQFVRLVRETPVGRQVKVKVVRASAPLHLTAQIGERNAGPLASPGRELDRAREQLDRMSIRMRTLPDGWMTDTPHAVMGWRSGMLGIDGESVEGQLADYFGVKDGVLVRSVGKDTPAARAGMRAGDVVIKVEDARVNSPRAITNAMRTAAGKRPLRFTVIRHKVETPIDVTLDESKPAPLGVTVGQPKEFPFEF